MKKVPEIKEMQNSIRFDLSSSIIILFQFQKKKVPKNEKKTQNLTNGEFYEKSL